MTAELDDARFRYRFRLEPSDEDRCIACAHFALGASECMRLDIAVARGETSRCPLFCKRLKVEDDDR